MQASKILNFADANTLDSTVVFTRASGANTHPGTYFDANGIMQESSYNTPRFNFNPVTGVARGLMSEEARTNQLIYSGDFGNAAWTVIAPLAKTGITRTGLGGDLTGYTFTTSASGGSFYQDVTATGTSYQGNSIHVHISSTCTDANLVVFWFIGGTTQQVALRFNPSTGAFISTGTDGTYIRCIPMQIIIILRLQDKMVGAGAHNSKLVRTLRVIFKPPRQLRHDQRMWCPMLLQSDKPMLCTC